MSKVQSPPVGNLKERIAALQQRNVSPSHNGSSPPPTSNSSPSNGNVGSLRSKIAKFEQKGGVPIPRGSFGLGAPPEGGHNTSRELYGNRIPSVNRPSRPVSRSGSPLPFAVDDSPTSPPVERRRGSSGTFEVSTQVDLANVSQKLTFQRNMDILNRTLFLDANGFERTQSPNTDTPTSPGSNSMARLGARRSSASNSDALSTLEESPDMSARSPPSSPLRGIQSVTASSEEKPVTPSIVVSPEPLSVSLNPNIVEDAPKVEEPSAIADDDVQKALEPAESTSSPPLTPDEPVTLSSPPPKAASDPDDLSHAVTGPSPAVSPSASPLISPTSSNRTVVAQQDKYQSPVPESLETASMPSSPVANIQAPVTPVSPITSRSNSQSTSAPAAIQPKRSSSLQTVGRPSRSPSPTPSMIHQSDARTSTPIAPPPPEEPKVTPRKPRSISNANSSAQRTIVGLPTNPPPAPDDEDADINYGVVTLGHSTSSNKSGFTSIVHQKVIETSPTTSPQKPPIKRITADNVALPSPGFGDLATLLEEAALLEERLKQDETTGDLVRAMDGMSTDMSQFELQPFSIGSQEVTVSEQQHEESEEQDDVPPTPPPKGFTRVLSGMKKLASSGTLRSLPSAHSRFSTSGSELSSEDSASVGTPSDNGLQYLASRSSFDRSSVGGLGIGYPSQSSSPRKSVSSIGRAGSFADRLWHRSRTKTINSSENGDAASIHSQRGQSNIASPPKQSRQTLPPLPTITVPSLLEEDGTDGAARPISWLSQSSASSTNTTTSTVSPGETLFDEALYNAFPSVPQEVPRPVPFPRYSLDNTGAAVGRSATLPVRPRMQSSQKLR